MTTLPRARSTAPAVDRHLVIALVAIAFWLLGVALCFTGPIGPVNVLTAWLATFLLIAPPLAEHYSRDRGSRELARAERHLESVVSPTAVPVPALEEDTGRLPVSWTVVATNINEEITGQSYEPGQCLGSLSDLAEDYGTDEDNMTKALAYLVDAGSVWVRDGEYYVTKGETYRRDAKRRNSRQPSPRTPHSSSPESRVS